jgi:hypothetical protein
LIISQPGAPYKTIQINNNIKAHFEAKETGIAGSLQGYGPVEISFITMTLEAPRNVSIGVLQGGGDDHNIPIASKVLQPHDDGGNTYDVSAGKILRFQIGQSISPLFVVPSP